MKRALLIVVATVAAFAIVGLAISIGVSACGTAPYARHGHWSWDRWK